MDWSNLITLVVGLVAGGIAALKVIAPKTANKTDDAVLARLEAVEKLLEGLATKK
jgi:hypothetical protein